MIQKIIAVFLFDGFSDWEISYAMPELKKSEKYDLKTFSFNGQQVISAGGLKVCPDLAMKDIVTKDIAMLILPGGEAWEKRELEAIKPLLKSINNSQNSIAAICGATVGLADSGILNNISHTSNAPGYLETISSAYKGEKYYSTNLAVTSGHIITASGIAPVEFAREIFRKLELFDEYTLEKWFQLFKNGIWTG